MIDKSRLDEVAKYVDLSRDRTYLIWKPRTPDMFNTADPVRTARGWNQKWAGQMVQLNRNGQFSVKRTYYSASTVIRHLGGTNTGIRLSTGMRGHVGGDFDDKAIRMIWMIDDNGYVVWRPRQMDIVVQLKAMAQELESSRGRSVGTFNERGLKRFNAIYAGKPAKPRPDGFVYLSGGLRARMDEICRAFRVPMKIPPRATRKTSITPVTDDLIRTIFTMDATGTIWHRKRDTVAWQKLTLEGCVRGVPYESEIERWNWRHENKPVPVSNENVVRIGTRSTSFNRIFDALRSQNVGKPAILDTNPYSF